MLQRAIGVASSFLDRKGRLRPMGRLRLMGRLRPMPHQKQRRFRSIARIFSEHFSPLNPSVLRKLLYRLASNECVYDLNRAGREPRNARS